MPRENSFSDSEGRSLTPDFEDEMDHGHEPLDLPPRSPVAPRPRLALTDITTSGTTAASPMSATLPKPPSVASARRSYTAQPRPPPTLTPKERFQASVRKVIAMHRTSSMLARGNIGAEPGIDVRRSIAHMTYGHIRQKCIIDLVDYSPLRASSGRMTNAEFVGYLQSVEASAREPWVRVRWINVGGISWDIISALALTYNLHPLALEDLLQQRGHARSKADYYPQHLFIRALCHSLAPKSSSPLSSSSRASSDSGPTLTGLPRSSSPQPLDEKLGILNGSDGEDDPEEDGSNKVADPEARGSSGLGFKRSSLQARKRSSAANAMTIERLKKGRVDVRIAPMCIFLFRNGTVISIHPDANMDFTSPIAARIRQRDTSLRTSADASLLVESLLDLIVDTALEVVDEYRVKIHKLEQQILIQPKVGNVRDLHILSGDLILHKRTLEPIKTLVYGLRRYDTDRCLALIDPSKTVEGQKVTGFMSHKSNIYLADVHNHMEYILSSLDMYAAMAENLINYTFNMASYEMNEGMRRLTLATIIFLPLTLLTGYFGMNFENMWSVNHGHSDRIFWAIALPLMAIVVPIFTMPDLKRLIHYMKKQMVAKRVKKEYKYD